MQNARPHFKPTELESTFSTNPNSGNIFFSWTSMASDGMCCTGQEFLECHGKNFFHRTKGKMCQACAMERVPRDIYQDNSIVKNVR